MSWLVVKFDAENTVEAVPNTWYVKDKLQCYWPSEGTAKDIVIKLIKKKRSPQANWKLYDASMLGCYGDYKIAQKKANKAKNTNNLSSNNENLKQKSRSKKQIRKRHHKRFGSEYELSSETEISSLDDTIYPHIEETQLSNKETDIEENFESINHQANVYNKERTNKIDNNSAIASTSSCTTSTVKATLQHKSPLVLEHNTEFEKRVLRELHILSLKIDDILESINVLIKNKVDESQNPAINNKVPDIVELFPVNDESLAKLENWLTSSAENKAMLSENLSRIGESNVKDIVRRLMNHIFTNKVGMSYTWEGTKKKKVFKNLAVATTILSAVRLNKNTQYCTDVEIINVIKAWLVRSKDRFNNNNKNEV